MSKRTLNFIVFLALLVHGIGHFQGVVSSLGVRYHKSTSHISWLLKKLGVKINRVICFSLYFITALLAILAALSFYDILLPADIWTRLALPAAFFSSAALVLFPRALVMFFNKAGAIMVNLVIFYSILFNGNWPESVFGD